MKCVKCGTEYEGNTCPKCNGPDILINNADYLARKKAYEERQAKLKADKKDSKSESLSLHIEPKSSEKQRDVKKKIIIQKKYKKLAIKILALLVMIIAAVSVMLVVFNLKKHHIYFMASDGISIDSTDNKTAFKELVYTSDGATVYKRALPDTLSNKNIAGALTSYNEKYAAYVTYNKDDGIYNIYQSDGKELKNVSEGINEKKLLYTGNDGSIIYTEIAYIGDVYTGENMVDSIDLKQYKDGSITTLVQKQSLVYIYPESDKYICLDMDGALWDGSLEKQDKKRRIAENVDVIYSMDDNNKGHYVTNGAVVKTNKDNSSICVSMDNEYYQINLKDDTYTNLFKSSNGIVSIGIDSGNSVVYGIGNYQAGFTTIKSEEMAALTPIENYNSYNDCIYIGKNNELVIVNKEQQLVSASSKGKQVLTDNVESKTLRFLSNSGSGYTYSADSNIYYRSSSSSDAVKIGTGRTDSATMYKKNLYFIIDNKLYMANPKSGESKEIGEFTGVWVD